MFYTVSIPSGRGFWAGMDAAENLQYCLMSQSPLVGASGPAKTLGFAYIIPYSLNPLWSGLLGRR